MLDIFIGFYCEGISCPDKIFIDLLVQYAHDFTSLGKSGLNDDVLADKVGQDGLYILLGQVAIKSPSHPLVHIEVGLAKRILALPVWKREALDIEVSEMVKFENNVLCEY